MSDAVRIGVSLVVAVLTTWGASAALWHVGHDLRQYKNHRRHLDLHALGFWAKFGLTAVGVLMLLVASGAYYRVYVEGEFSGDSLLASLLAALVAIVLLISAGLLFETAFKDGSPERDDMAFYARVVARHLIRRRTYLLKADDCRRKIQVIQETACSGHDIFHLEPLKPSSAEASDVSYTALASGAERPPLPSSTGGIDTDSRNASGE